MRVAGNKRGRFRELGCQRHYAVGEVVPSDACFQTHVASQNNCIGPFALCFLNRATNRFHWIGRFETAREFRPEPKRQARGNYIDDGDTDSGELFQNVRPNFSQGVLCVGNLAGRSSFQQTIRGQDRHL